VSNNNVAGGLFHLNISSYSVFVLSGVVVTNITVNNTMTDGGIGAVFNALQVSITDSLFINITSGKVGGAFVFQNLSSYIQITGSKFSLCTASESGGAISFLSETYFQIVGTNFTGCQSTNSYGGALSSSSTSTNNRILQNCLFSGNSAYQYIGLDIYDSSNISTTIYTKSSVVGTLSTSVVDGSYILFAATQVSNVSYFFDN
jgi:hypothetical protein